MNTNESVMPDGWKKKRWQTSVLGTDLTPAAVAGCVRQPPCLFRKGPVTANTMKNECNRVKVIFNWIGWESRNFDTNNFLRAFIFFIYLVFF